IVAAATERGLRLPTVQDFDSAPGRGVRATIDGQTVEVGSPRHLMSDVDKSTPMAAAVPDLEAAGKTVVIVVADGAAAGILALADQLRPGAADTVAELTAVTGTATVLLTGDNARAPTTRAAHLGITDIRAGLLPQDKVTAVRELEDAGRRVLL